jgi:hypothetical protein
MERAYRRREYTKPEGELNSERNQPSLPPAIDSVESANEQRSALKIDYLINKLNYINFQNDTIQVVMSHRRYEQTMTAKARPLPCSDGHLECAWLEPEKIGRLVDNFNFTAFYVDDGATAIRVEPRLLRMDAEGFAVELPDQCWEIANRRETRIACDEVPVQVIQHSMLFRGFLREFSTGSFLVELDIKPPQTHQCLDPEKPLNLIVYDGGDLIYSGDFKILKQDHEHRQHWMVLEPLALPIHRYNPRAYRSKRLKLTPTPNVVFKHPLTRHTVNLKVLDVSGSGLSVIEGVGHSLLLPGMMLPDVELIFADSLTIRFKAQVLYRNLSDCDEDACEIINGLAIIDMDSGEHLKLLSLLHQADNKNSYINTRIEMDALWDFFFETGFIYPKKYAYIQANKEKIKETYWKLYTQNPTIARHFIYQNKGRIMAHMAMVRLYENAWLIHHHAARKRSMVRAGLTVLNQIGCFTYDSHRLYSMHMKYLMCYYRPENHFPQSVFGGFNRYAKDQDDCSVDEFAYCHMSGDAEVFEVLPPEWEITTCDRSDLQELGHWYQHYSGGLMLDCLDLMPHSFEAQDLVDEYRRHGFTKERRVLALRRNGRLIACILIHHSEIGLNLSDLTNCVKVMIIDHGEVDRHIIDNALRRIVRDYKLSTDMPLLMYPIEAVEKMRMPFEKTYCLWILNTRNSDKYFKFIDRMFRMAGHSK